MVSAISSNFYLRESNSNRAVNKSEVLVASGDIKNSHLIGDPSFRMCLKVLSRLLLAETVSIYKKVRNQ